MAIYGPTTEIIWHTARSYELDPDRIFRQAGIDPALRNDTNARIPRKSLDCLIALVYEATGDLSFGVRAVQSIHPSHLGPLGYAWLTSASLADAFGRFERYSRVVVDRLEMWHEREKEGVRVSSSFSKGAIIGPMNHLFALALMVQISRMNVGKSFTPLGVTMDFDEPGNIRPLEEHFRCPLKFRSKENSLLIAHGDWERNLPRANPELAALHDEIVIKHLARVDRGDIVSQVKAAIFELLGTGDLAADDVAARMHMTARTLRRKLDDEGISYRAVLNDLRQDLAMRYIADESIALTEMSYLLGFSQPSSLSRAFRVWTGKSPSEVRAQVLADRS